MLAATHDYIESLRDDLKRAAKWLSRYDQEHEATCCCDCCTRGCGGLRLDSCEVGQFIKRIETT